MKKMVCVCLLMMTTVVLAACGKHNDAYWCEQIEGYTVSLQDGTAENTLDIIVQKGKEEWHVLSFDTTNDYRKPEDITVDTFEDVMGHSGFRISERMSEMDYVDIRSYHYYTVVEEPVHLAYHWGQGENPEEETFFVDLDDDGTKEMICNVQYMADGVLDTMIYHWDGENVMYCSGIDVMYAQEPEAVMIGAGSVGAEYIPEENKLYAWFWDEEKQDFEENKYEIDLNEVEMWEYQ